VDRAYPPALDEIEHILHYGAVTGVDASAQLEYWGERIGEPIGEFDVEPNTWALAEMGRAITAEQLRTSLEWLEGFTRRVLDWWEGGFDLLVTPTLAEPPPPLGELVSTRSSPLAAGLRAGAIVPFTPPFNTTGQPAISLPLHWSDEAIPIGVQIVSAPKREDLLIAVAAQLEKARQWADRRPPVSA
jgi:amidase